jgi:long-chain acyl-CoA synthetase
MASQPTISVDPNWPAMPLTQAKALLTAPGAPFEMDEVAIGGVPTRIWKNAPPSLPWFIGASRAAGDQLFVIHEDERVTYEAHHRAVAALAAYLAGLGVGRSDRVALAMRNLPEWPVAFFAITALGAIAVPLNAWWTGAELEYGLTDSGARVLIVDEERHARLAERYAAAPAMEHVLVARASTPLDGIAARLEDAIGTPHDWARLPDAPLPDVAVVPEEDAAIFYTSGTTGAPKGALVTHRNLMSNVLSNGYSSARSALRRGETPAPPSPRVLLTVIPLFHVTACSAALMPAIATGSTMIFMRKWDTIRAFEIIERERVNITGGVPTIAWQLLEHPDRGRYDLSSLESIAYGGAPSAPELVKRIHEELGALPGNGWGMTETCATLTHHSGEEYLMRPDSAGPPVAVAHDRGAMGARADDRARLLEPAGGQRRDLRRRVGANGRSGAGGRGGFPVHRRPRQGHGHPWRREHLFDRGRERPVRASRRYRLRPDRNPAPDSGGGAGGGGPSLPRVRSERGGVAGLGAGATRRVQGAGGDPLRGRHAAPQRQWQDREVRAEGAVRRLTGAFVPAGDMVSNG